MEVDQHTCDCGETFANDFQLRRHLGITKGYCKYSRVPDTERSPAATADTCHEHCTEWPDASLLQQSVGRDVSLLQQQQLPGEGTQQQMFGEGSEQQAQHHMEPMEEDEASDEPPFDSSEELAKACLLGNIPAYAVGRLLSVVTNPGFDASQVEFRQW